MLNLMVSLQMMDLSVKSQNPCSIRDLIRKFRSSFNFILVMNGFSF